VGLQHVNRQDCCLSDVSMGSCIAFHRFFRAVTDRIRRNRKWPSLCDPEEDETGRELVERRKCRADAAIVNLASQWSMGKLLGKATD
jgi:hypothetical protein